MSERFLKWAIKRHYKALGYKVSMRRIRLGNTEVDGEAIGPQGERIEIEIKTPRDDLARGIGQLVRLELKNVIYTKKDLQIRMMFWWAGGDLNSRPCGLQGFRV